MVRFKIYYVDFTTSAQLAAPEVVGTTYVYVADTGNHWIRKISLGSSNVDTVVGVCGTPGFKDGPLGTNLLNSPELVSVDKEGIFNCEIKNFRLCFYIWWWK